jgi:hypothetical protein
MGANLCDCFTGFTTRSSEVHGTNLGRSRPVGRVRERCVNRPEQSVSGLSIVNQGKCSCSGGGHRLTISLRMTRNCTSSRWAAIALAVTLVLFFVSNLSSAHSHDGVSARGCDLCHTAKLPALCLPVGPTIVLPAHAEWHFPLVVFFRALESDRLSGPSRAPPLS